MIDQQVRFGNHIRARRKELGLTQQDLAKALGTTEQHISLLELNKRTCSLRTLIKLSDILGTTADYLLRGKGEKRDFNLLVAIKADKSLSLKVKKALITLLEELRQSP